MKKFFTIVAMAATAAFASCNKDNEGVNPAEGEQAKLTIGVSGANTRAAGQLTDDSDNGIGEFMAFAFQGETLKAVLTSTDGTAVSKTTNITTSIDAVYVFANANSYFATAVPGTTTKTDFQNTYSQLLSASYDLRILTNGKVWASSALKTLTPGDFTGANREASITIPVVPVAARINVAINDERDNLGSAGAWVLTGTQMLNVPATTRSFPPAGYVSPNGWLSGYANPGNPGTVVRSYLEDGYSATGHMFYALDNDASEFPTILTLTASNDGGVTKRYFPLQFTLADAGRTIERGNSYQVTFTLTGNALDDPGIVTPEEPVITGKLTVAVTATPWTMVPVNKTF